MADQTPTWRTCRRCRTQHRLPPHACVTAADDDTQPAARTRRARADLTGSWPTCRERGFTPLSPQGTSLPGSHDRSAVDPGDPGVAASTVAEAIEALMRCAALSMQCADACLSEQDVGRLTKCIRLNLGCANLCTVTARVIARPVGCEPDVARRAIEACITVCRGSANECSAHAARLEHCRISAEASRACEQSCQALLQAMS